MRDEGLYRHTSAGQTDRPKRGDLYPRASREMLRRIAGYFRCLLTSLVISNMFT
jgi:hypothetical protein